MRLDTYLYNAGKTVSRSRAKELIEKGAVKIGEKTISKASFDVPDDISPDFVIIEEEKDKYVSRGGYKLEGALKEFAITPHGCIALDIGASTGGFTDCLLKNGAKKVYAVDSGKGQLAPSLINDARVIMRENYNARYMLKSDFPDEINFVTMDVSFISQTLIIPQISHIISNKGIFISLIKPQFEVGRQNIGKNGIVKNDTVRKIAIDNVCKSAEENGFSTIKIVPSPIKGGDGNIEFLAYFSRS